MIALVPPQARFHHNAVAFGLDHHGGGDQRRFGAVEIAHKGFKPAFIIQDRLLFFGATAVGENDIDAGIQEGEFAQPVFERVVIKFDHGEGFGRGQEGHFRAALVARGAEPLKRRFGIAMFEGHHMLVAIAPDAQAQPFRQGIDHRHADAMQAARHFVGVLVEFTARMQLRHDHFGRRNPLFGMDIGGDAASVVGDGAGSVGIERHGHFRGVTGQRLVNRIIDDFVNHVMQARAVIGVADIHAGALADGIQAFENFNRIGTIGGGGVIALIGVGHVRKKTLLGVEGIAGGTAFDSLSTYTGKHGFFHPLKVF